MQLLSAFGGGLFIIPLLLLAALVYSIYRLIQVRRGGTYHYDRSTGRKWYTSDTPPFHLIFTFWTSIILFFSLLGAIILMLNDK